MMLRDAPSTADPLWGRAAYAFAAKDDLSHVWIYDDGNRGFVYELHSQHGWLHPGGGTTVFLGAKSGLNPPRRMDKTTTLRLRTKLKQRVAEYQTAAARTNGAVLWLYFTGLIFHFIDPATHRRYNLFLQIRLANARDMRKSHRKHRARYGMLWGGILAGDSLLTQPDPKGPLVALEFNVNRYLCAAARASYPSTLVEGGQFELPTTAADLRNWEFRGLYIGLETQSGFATDRVRQGTAAATVQIADLHLTATSSPSPNAHCR